MANPEHLKILKKGVEAWNKWRIENPDTVPDLVGADLIGANLNYANLTGANLSRTYLNGADLPAYACLQCTISYLIRNRESAKVCQP